MSLRAELLVKADNAVGESPVWDAASQSLYWVDIPKGLIQRRTPDGKLQHWVAPSMIGAIVLTETGDLLAATAGGFARVSLGLGEAQLTPIVDVLPENSGKRFNDGACDRQGRFWSGTMRLEANPVDPGGTLYRLDEEGMATPHLHGFVTQNGLAWSPDGRTMYVSDSHPSV